MLTPVGYIISWQVPTTVKLADLRAGIAAIGHDPMDLAPDLKPQSLVARSAGRIARGISAKDRKGLARKVEHTVRQITVEQPDGMSGLLYTRSEAIGYDETTGKLTSTIGLDHSSVQREIDETRRATDVTRVIQTVVEAAGSDLIQIREQGGAYFVPAGHSLISRVATVLNHVGGRLSQFACTIGHGDTADQTGQSVANVITDYLLKQIDELNAAVAELGEKGIRSDARRNRLTRVAQLKERVSAYASLLGAQHGSLVNAMDKAEEMLLAKLGPEKEEAEPDPKDAAFAAAAGGDDRGHDDIRQAM